MFLIYFIYTYGIRLIKLKKKNQSKIRSFNRSLICKRRKKNGPRPQRPPESNRSLVCGGAAFSPTAALAHARIYTLTTRTHTFGRRSKLTSHAGRKANEEFGGEEGEIDRE